MIVNAQKLRIAKQSEIKPKRRPVTSVAVVNVIEIPASPSAFDKRSFGLAFSLPSLCLLKLRASPHMSAYADRITKKSSTPIPRIKNGTARFVGVWGRPQKYRNPEEPRYANTGAVHPARADAIFHSSVLFVYVITDA